MFNKKDVSGATSTPAGRCLTEALSLNKMTKKLTVHLYFAYKSSKISKIETYFLLFFLTRYFKLVTVVLPHQH